MADYFEQTVVQHSIPEIDITRLEWLLLSRIFNSERDGLACRFFAEDNPCTIVQATRDKLVKAIALSSDRESTAHRYVTERLAAVGPDAVEIDLDLTGTSGEFFLQDVVKRSQTLACISVVAAFTRMRPHGFGGMALLITADAIRGKSTTTSSRGACPRPDSTAMREGPARCAMSIPEHARANFQTLLCAAAEGNLALMECTDAVTGEPRYVICAVGRDGASFVFTPFGDLADGNPFDVYLPPSDSRTDPSAS
jgi:hypothetical protein